MRATILAGFCAALGMLAGGCGGSDLKPEVTGDNVTLKIAPDSPKFARGGPVTITATITNASSGKQYLAGGGLWLNNEYHFGLKVEVLDEKGVVFVAPKAPGDYPMPGVSDFKELDPAQSFTVSIDLGLFASPQRGPLGKPLNQTPGDYTVRVQFANTLDTIPGDPVRREEKRYSDIWKGETPWAETEIRVE